MGLGRVYDPFGDQHVANPYPFFARARAEEPVFFSERLGFWVVSKHDDVTAVLKDHRRFTAANLSARKQSPAVRELLGDSLMVPSLQELDPPDHTLLRGNIMKSFSVRGVAVLEPAMRGFADRLIDRFGESGEGDFVELFANPFPAMVIGHLVNVPERDFHQVQEWADAIVVMALGAMPEDEELSYAKRVLDFRHHVYGLIERRRATPGDDLASALVESSLNDDQIAGLLQLVLMAGFETTAKLLGLTLRTLLADRATWEAIVAEPTGIAAVAEEAMRFDGPVVSAMRRAREDVEIGGKLIRRGELVQALLGSANHDESVFADPESFCPSRKENAAPLMFGAGAHYCLGAALGRLEVRVALEQLTSRLPSLRLAPNHQINYMRNLNVRGPLSLLVEWG